MERCKALKNMNSSLVPLYTHTHTHTHVRTHAHTHARTHARTHERAHTHTRTNARCSWFSAVGFLVLMLNRQPRLAWVSKWGILLLSWMIGIYCGKMHAYGDMIASYLPSTTVNVCRHLYKHRKQNQVRGWRAEWRGLKSNTFSKNSTIQLSTALKI